MHEAQQLFFSQGLKGVSMDAVAAAAGIKKANLFHYFPSKEALELAVLDRFSADLREHLAAQFAATADDPIAAVAAMFEEAARGMRRRRYRGGCFAGNLALEASDHRESVRLRVAQLLRFWVSEVARLLDRGRAAGLLPARAQAGAGRGGDPVAVRGLAALLEGQPQAGGHRQRQGYGDCLPGSVSSGPTATENAPASIFGASSCV